MPNASDVAVKTSGEFVNSSRLLVERTEHAGFFGRGNSRLIGPRQPQIPHPPVIGGWRCIFHVFHFQPDGPASELIQKFEFVRVRIQVDLILQVDDIEFSYVMPDQRNRNN